MQRGARRAWKHPARQTAQNYAMRLAPLRWLARHFHQTGAMDDAHIVVSTGLDRARGVFDGALRANEGLLLSRTV